MLSDIKYPDMVIFMILMWKLDELLMSLTKGSTSWVNFSKYSKAYTRYFPKITYSSFFNMYFILKQKRVTRDV